MAKITILQGKDKGKTFELTAEEIFVGRDSAGQIVLNDASVSRRHCFIEKRAEGFFITDLQSLNGTFVNEENAENLRLKNGDVIRIGDFSLRFSSDNAAELPSSSAVFFDERNLDLSKTIHLRLEEILGEMTRDLFGFIKISEKINSVRGLEKLQKELLEEIFEVVPAREGAILLLDKDGDITETFALNLDDNSADVKISRTILEIVLKNNEAILANNIGADENLKTAESLVVSQVSAVLCVPLIVFARKIGVIYLASRRASAKFDESHLRFMSAMSSIAAVAIENIRNIEILETENARLRAETLLERNMIGESPAMKKIFALI